MALDKDIRQRIAADLAWLSAIEIWALIRNADPSGKKNRESWSGTPMEQALRQRELAEQRLNIIIDDLQVNNATGDFCRLIDLLDEFIEGKPAEEILGG